MPRSYDRTTGPFVKSSLRNADPRFSAPDWHTNQPIQSLSDTAIPAQVVQSTPPVCPRSLRLKAPNLLRNCHIQCKPRDVLVRTPKYPSHGRSIWVLPIRQDVDRSSRKRRRPGCAGKRNCTNYRSRSHGFASTSHRSSQLKRQ